jgi:FkbM family methyltransferase
MLRIIKDIYYYGRIYVSKAISWPVILAIKRLPKRIAVEIYQAIELYKEIDYKPTKILIMTSNDLEYDLRTRAFSKEPETVKWIEDVFSQNSVLYDIGANIGAYSLIAAKTGKFEKIYAFEPVPTTYQNLVKNVLLNNADQVIPLNVAISNKLGISKFGLESLKAGGARHSGLLNSDDLIQINVLCLDLNVLVSQIGLSLPTHVKIDVDGAELYVLEGIRSAFISQNVKSVLIEVDTNSLEAEKIFEFFEEYSFEESSRHQRGRSQTFNVIFQKK